MRKKAEVKFVCESERRRGAFPDGNGRDCVTRFTYVYTAYAGVDTDSVIIDVLRSLKEARARAVDEHSQSDDY